MCLDSNALEWTEDPILRYIPNQSFTTIHINNFGFRGQDIVKEKPDEMYRIFVVGGSTVFGYGSTSDDTTIAGFLQKELKNNLGSKNIEVINAGVGHATSFEEKYLIKNTITEFSPNMIIIYDGWNDAGNRKINGLEPTGITEKDDNPFKFKNYPFYKTPFVLWENIFRHVEETSPVIVPTSPEIEEKVTSLWKQNIEDMCKTVEKNTKVMIFLQPLSDQSKSKEKINSNSTIMYFTDPDIRILEMFSEQLDDLKKSCDKVVDLTNVFIDTKEHVFYDKGHVNDLGNKIIAEKIYEKILPTVLEDISK